MELTKDQRALVEALAAEPDPLVSILIESDNGPVAKALGRVIGQAVQDVGFGNITVKHNPNLADDEPGEYQSDWEQGKSMLEAIADASPSLWQQRVEVVSFCLSEPEDQDDLPPEESAHIAEIVADD